MTLPWRLLSERRGSQHSSRQRSKESSEAPPTTPAPPPSAAHWLCSRPRVVRLCQPCRQAIGGSTGHPARTSLRPVVCCISVWVSAQFPTAPACTSARSCRCLLRFAAGKIKQLALGGITHPRGHVGD